MDISNVCFLEKYGDLHNNSQPSRDLPQAHTSMLVISGVGAHSFICSPYLIMNYKIFMCQESQSFKIYDIIWCWKHAADIETCHYIKDFTCIFVNSPASQNTNLFKVELWPGFTWKKKKNHYLSHGWLGVKKFEWTQYRLCCPCTNLSRRSQTCFYHLLHLPS